MEKQNKRLTLEVPDDLHKEVKIRAAIKNITIRAWIIRAIAEAIKTEKQYE